MATLILERAHRLYAIVTVMRSLPPNEHMPPKGQGFRAAHEAHDRLSLSLTGIFERHHAELAMPPDRCAAVFQGLLNTVHFPFTDPKTRLDVDEVVTATLHGVARRPE